MNIKDIKDIIDDVKDLAQGAKSGFLDITEEANSTQRTNHNSENFNYEEDLAGLEQLNTPKEKQKRIRILIAVLVVLVLGFLALIIFKPSNSDDRKTKIANTTNVVSEIRKMSEFTTAAFYKELVLQDVKYKYKERNIYKKSDNWYKRQLGLDKEVIETVTDSTEIGRIVLIAKGTIRAGFNFSRLTANDFEVRQDTLLVSMPQSEIFDVIINPSDIEFFDRKGNYWDEENIKEIINNGKSEMYKHAINENIFEKANKYGIEKMCNILKTFGFKEVVVTIKEPEIDLSSIPIDQPKP